MGLVRLPKRYHPDFRYPHRRPIGDVEVDFSNPLAKGLTGCFLFQPKAPLRNHVEGMPSIDVGAGPGLNSRTGADVQTSDAVVYELSIDRTLMNGAANFDTDHSVITVMDVQKSPVSTNDQNILTANSTSAATDSLLYFDNVGGAGSGRLTSFITAGSHKIAITSRTPDFTPGVFECYATTNAAEPNTRALYIEGGDLGGGAQTSHTGVTYARPFENSRIHLFSQVGDATRRILAAVRHLYVFNRTLSDEEIFALHRRPYELLKPRRPISYFIGEQPPALQVVGWPI